MVSAVVQPRLGRRVLGTRSRWFDQRRPWTDRTVGALVLAAFCLMIAGPNLPTALLPAYRAAFRMTPFGLSLLFAIYLIVLVPMLLLSARPAWRDRAPALLISGLAAALASDILMAIGHSALLLIVGRVLSGISVAASTGAAAALMVVLVGERGRGSVATGNIAGALLGTVAALTLAQLGIGRDIYLAHAVAVLVVLSALGWASAGRVIPDGGAMAARVLAPDTPVGGPPQVGVPLPGQFAGRRHRALGFGAGAVGWTIPGVITGLVPAMLREFTGPTAIVVATAPAILLLGSAWALQILARRPLLHRVRGYELTVGTAMGGLGLALLAAGALLRSVPLVYLGCVIAAGGPALAYRGGMMLLTRGLSPAQQGAVTAGYAARCYGAAAAVVLGSGAIGALLGGGGGGGSGGGIVTAVIVGAGLPALVAIGLLMTIVLTESRPARRSNRLVQVAVRVRG